MVIDERVIENIAQNVNLNLKIVDAKFEVNWNTDN